MKTKEDTVAAIRLLVDDLKANGDSEEWENPTLELYLEAMAAWLEDSVQLSAQPSWDLIIGMLSAAKIYE